MTLLRLPENGNISVRTNNSLSFNGQRIQLAGKRNQLQREGVAIRSEKSSTRRCALCVRRLGKWNAFLLCMILGNGMILFSAKSSLSRTNASYESDLGRGVRTRCPSVDDGSSTTSIRSSSRSFSVSRVIVVGISSTGMSNCEWSMLLVIDYAAFHTVDKKVVIGKQ